MDFNFHVRPILSDRCLKCHGPDEKARKANLRLDVPESALGMREGRKLLAIIPGHAEKSELWRRITSRDPDQMMPPPGSKLELSEREKEILRDWIKQGAEYKRHWAFIPVSEVAVPAVRNAGQVRNAIDAFVLQRLEKEGLTLSKEASKETLVRRLSLDLRGLPPTVQEIDAFSKSDPFSYEQLVDNVLASAAYGEHQANDWLDLARYADTYGYQADVDCDLSSWRDWVIKSFNDNLPYNDFVRWQLAGDLLPDATRETVLATAFNRLHRQTNEGGSIEEEFRTEYAADRVQTMGTAILGLTLGCARCHDHKYDPVSQKDFYRLFAFFNNIDESGLYSHFTRAIPAPTLRLYEPGVGEKHTSLKTRIAKLEQQIESEERLAKSRFETWAEGHPELSLTAPVNLFSFDRITNGVGADSTSTNGLLVLVDGPEIVEGKIGRALRFSGDNSAVCKGAGAFNRITPFSFALWLKPAGKQERAVVFHRSRAWTDSGSRGYELVLEQGKPTFSLIHFWPGNAVRVDAKTSLPEGTWSHLVVTYDGSSRAAGVRLYLNGTRMETQTVRDGLFKDIVHRTEWGDADVDQIELTLAGRFRDSGFRNGTIDELQVYDRCLTDWEVQELIGINPAQPDREALLQYYIARVDTECGELTAQLAAARREENQLVNDVREIMVMSEMPQRRPTHVLKRGAYDAPGEEVTPGTPEAILPFSADLPRNRLGLAAWVVSKANPLTARVAVNRAWRQHFGRGLVATEEDFGIQGTLPTHPELLDWLAWQFMTSGWDLKALHKLIVSSAVYRQTSVASPELLAKDPENRLLARGPTCRLRAEEIRDSALAASGLLSKRVGGPSVKPYQPEGLWEESGTGKHYVQDTGESLYRRSLYTFWRRTAPPPSMVVFDAPSREVCTARREATTTPLQALVLLNDPQFVEAARVLAEKMLQSGGEEFEGRINAVCRALIGRELREGEAAVFRRMYEEQLAYFNANTGAAEKYLKTGSRVPNGASTTNELAAMAVVTSAIMNLDEFVMKR
jgi:hypothetical protein